MYLLLILTLSPLTLCSQLSIDPNETSTPKVEVRKLKRDHHHQTEYVYPDDSSLTRAGLVDFSGAKRDPETGKLCVVKDQVTDIYSIT